MKFSKEMYREMADMYAKGKSMNYIAKKFHTYATTVRRILVKQDVELRHDAKKDGTFYAPHGEKLIEWAKAQKRLVTQAELAEVIGTKRLSPSYFLKYPELGQYIIGRGQNELQEYSQKLYDWLQKNNISYKPYDRTELGVSITALLLDEYEGFAIQLNIKPTCVSKKQYTNKMQKIYEKSKKVDLTVIFIDENYFKDLTILKSQLEELKNLK